MNFIALLLSLMAPVPCSTWELHDDASLTCDGTTYQDGAYVLRHDTDDGDILGASAWRAGRTLSPNVMTCDGHTPERFELVHDDEDGSDLMVGECHMIRSWEKDQ